MADPGYATGLRNAKQDATTTYAGNAAILRIYDGTRPSTGGAATTKLAEFTLGTPFAASAASAVLSPNLPSAATGLAAGTATWWRVVKSDGTTHVMDGDAGLSGSGKSMILSTTTVSVGLSISVTSWSITGGNA